jgi:hypothetical protein
VADYLTLEREQTMLEQVAGYVDRGMTFTDGMTAELVPGRIVTWSYFDLLGMRPAEGRLFTRADGQPGNPSAVIVSHGFWLDHLGGRADVIGKPVRLDGTDYVLAGVLPPAVGPLEQGREFFVAAQWTEPRRKGPFFLKSVTSWAGSTRSPAWRQRPSHSSG